MNRSQVTDLSIARMISGLLRVGVIASGMIVLVGGGFYLIQHGYELANYQNFRAQPNVNRAIGRILQGALSLQPRSIIQTGVLLLIATPVARVALSLIGFSLERDRAYVLITAIVLAVLIYSFFSGAAQG